MKIFRRTSLNDKLWLSITNISGADVINIDSNEWGSKSDPKLTDSEHFITYDEHNVWVMGESNIPHSLINIKDKILSRIQENEDIIFIDSGCTYQFLAALKSEKNFRLHLIGVIYDEHEDDRYSAHLRLVQNIDIFSSICYINSYPFLGDSKHCREDFELFHEYEAEVLKTIVPAISEIKEDQQMIYDHKLKKYQPFTISKDIMLLGNETKCLLERVASDGKNGKELCNKFRKLRIEYSDDNTAERKCHYNGPCKGVCNQCDLTSQHIWENKNLSLVTENREAYKSYELTGIFNGIERLRIDTDGKGVRSLILMAHCALDCKYCCNQEINCIFPHNVKKTPSELGQHLHKDGIYFESTGGGVTFGGGEPLLQADFIVQFKQTYPMWNIDIETSLNADYFEIEKLLDIVDVWHIDIKDMNPKIYKSYTGSNNSAVIDNLEELISRIPAERLHIRVPRIEGFNTESDIQNSVQTLKDMGFTDIEVFDYKIV